MRAIGAHLECCVCGTKKRFYVEGDNFTKASEKMFVAVRKSGWYWMSWWPTEAALCPSCELSHEVKQKQMLTFVGDPDLELT